ncbi:MAG TPA: small basic protein [bacterium]
MSIHPSLRSRKASTGALRNVLKRFERVRHLQERGTWTDGRSVYGLPKIKQTKVKARKSAAKETEAAAAAPAAPGAAGSTAA